MKKTIKIIITIVVFLIILLTCMHILSRIFVPKWLDNKDNSVTWISKGFYEERKNSLDVMFMGNSDMYRGVEPIQLWDDYGITSYAYVAAGQRMWTGYYMLKDALEYQKPSVILFNIDAAFNDTASMDGNYRKVYDNMKLNSTKIEAINDPVYNNDLFTKISYIFPILRYHSRYSDLSKKDFEYAFYDYHYAYKGMDLTADVVPYEKGDYMIPTDEITPLTPKAAKYLTKIVSLCKEKNIDLILTEIPSADSWNYKKHNAISAYADALGLKFLDLNIYLDEMNFDWKKDTSDGGDHLNVYGAEKVTKYIGSYLKDNYALADHRDDDIAEIWNEDSKTYHEDKEAKIKEATK